MTLQEAVIRCDKVVQAANALHNFLWLLKEYKIKPDIVSVYPERAEVLISTYDNPRQTAKKLKNDLEFAGLQCTDWMEMPGLDAFNWEMHCKGIKFIMIAIPTVVPKIVIL